MNRLKQIYTLRGSDAALAELKQMAEMFSGCRDWSDINNEVMAFLLEMKQQADQAEAERLAKREAALMSAIASNGLNGQINFMLGQSPQAPYYGTTTKAGDKH